MSDVWERAKNAYRIYYGRELEQELGEEVDSDEVERDKVMQELTESNVLFNIISKEEAKKNYIDPLQEYPIESHVMDRLDLEEPMALKVLSIMLDDLLLFEWKHKDYGPDNIKALGEPGIFVRCWDKINRLKSLVWEGNKAKVEEESVEDTWRDLRVYGYIAQIVREGEWQ